MRLMIAVIMGSLVAVSSPAVAASPTTSIHQRLALMDPEQRVEYAIATVTTNKREARCAKKIAYKESRYRVDAKNKRSSARGVWQLMWGKPHWSILKQVTEANKYVLHRYDSWCGAYRFHQERNWF